MTDPLDAVEYARDIEIRSGIGRPDVDAVCRELRARRKFCEAQYKIYEDCQWPTGSWAAWQTLQSDLAGGEQNDAD